MRYYLDRSKLFCDPCQFYSSDHHACFHPNAWGKSQTFTYSGTELPFKQPGDPSALNANDDCPWYDKIQPLSPGVQPIGHWAKLRQFFRPCKIRVTK